MYAKGFFDLQLEFAERVSALSGLPFARIVLAYTNFYIRFGFGRDFDGTDSRWQEYVAGLLDTDDRRDFPFQVLSLEAPVLDFYRFYGL